jgi:predicted PurR-regulated permease PerM
MSTTDNVPAPPNKGHLPAPELLKKLAIWVLFIIFLYLTRDFFFTGFMTFLFSYLALGLVGWGMRRLAGGRIDNPSQAERAGLRRLMTVGVFVLVPLVLLALGVLIAPRLVHQGQQLAGWLSQVNPETEVARLLEGFVGPAEFKHAYSGPDDPAYKKDFEKFKATEILHVQEYNDFPHLEAWVEGGFAKQFADAERGRVRSRLLRAGVSSKEFEQWFVNQKLPQLQEQAKKPAAERGAAPAGTGALAAAALARAAASAKPEQLLDKVRHDPALAAAVRDEWIAAEVEHASASGTPAYLTHFQDYYDKRRQESPTAVPYTFQQYIELQKARSQGPRVFGATLAKLLPDKEKASDPGADFEAAKKHELFREWWGSNSVAKFIRHQVEARSSGAGSDHMDRILAALLNLPVDLGTALLLSFFICIDFPQLKRALLRLRETWLRDVYDEIAPALTSLGHLIGRAMHAQGLIALCNAVMMFVALTILGVEHPVLLSCAVFLLCLVPTLGTIIAWVLIAAVALIQPGGGLVLALKASGAVFLVVLLETFVLSPRILGRMMELHPVLIIAILPVAQYFFGVWGLILATPVAVYVIHVLILQRGLPGSQEQKETVKGIRPDAPELAGRV